jgi:hypothetical protein
MACWSKFTNFTNFANLKSIAIDFKISTCPSKLAKLVISNHLEIAQHG